MSGGGGDGGRPTATLAAPLHAHTHTHTHKHPKQVVDGHEAWRVVFLAKKARPHLTKKMLGRPGATHLVLLFCARGVVPHKKHKTNIQTTPLPLSLSLTRFDPFPPPPHPTHLPSPSLTRRLLTHVFGPSSPVWLPHAFWGRQGARGANRKPPSKCKTSLRSCALQHCLHARDKTKRKNKAPAPTRPSKLEGQQRRPPALSLPPPLASPLPPPSARARRRPKKLFFSWPCRPPPPRR